jgi:hypothetical protein
MSLPAQKPILSSAPEEYNQVWMDSIVSELENFIQRLNTIGSVTAKTVRITDLPTSSAGLPSGSLWNDSGTVKVA